MADRYWVGGTDDWDATAGSKWAATSGGTGGESVPGASDNAIFDANSGDVVVTLAVSTVSCNNLDFTGFTGEFDFSGNNIQIFASFTFVASMTLTTNSSATIDMVGAAAGTFTLAFGGQRFNGRIQIIPTLFSQTFNLADDLDCHEIEIFDASFGTTTFNANNYNLNFDIFGGSNINGSNPVINMGTGTWTMDGVGAFGNTTSNLTINASTSTLQVLDTSATEKFIQAGGQTLGDIVVEGDNVKITGTVTCNNFALNNAGLTTGLIVYNGTTLIVSAFTSNGSSGNLTKILSDSAGSSFAIDCASQVSVDYMSIKDSAAANGPWYAGANSTNVSGNSGWIFTAPPGSSSITSFSGVAVASIASVDTVAIANIASINTVSN